jgi:chorismate synthase
MNFFGRNFRVATFGESHGVALGAVVDGCPAGLEISAKEIQNELNRRRPGQSKISTPRNESDRFQILSGIFENKTTGTPIAIAIFNENQKSKDYEKLKNVFRPGHADEVFAGKFGIRDHRGGGRASGRETVGRVVAGAIAKKLLRKICECEIFGHSIEIGGISAEKFNKNEIEKNAVRCADKFAAEKMIEKIDAVRAEKNSVGGVCQIEIENCPKFLGAPVFGKLEAELACAILSVGAARGFEFGAGFSAARNSGKIQNQISEGISGGISTGEKIILKIAVKPTPSISQKQFAKNSAGEKVEIEIGGRHDPVILPRAIPVFEAMTALVLADFVLAAPDRIDQIFRG